MKFKGCGKIWTKKSDAHSGQDIKKTVGPKLQIGLMIILPVIPSKRFNKTNFVSSLR